jgi:hypothetical protein
MISRDEAEKLFEQPTIEAIPTDLKRIIIPAFGFIGATTHQCMNWDTNAMEDVKGLQFYNAADKCNQVLKQKDGVLICYDAPGRQEKINNYIKAHPDTFKDAPHLKLFISYLSNNVVNSGGKADLYDSDTAFAAGLIGAPSKENIKVGHIFTGAKKKDTVQAVAVKEGTVYEGAEGNPQTADKGGAYILKDNNGIRMIQANVFKRAYVITKNPMMNAKSQDMSL